jgi:hypothetical protein
MGALTGSGQWTLGIDVGPFEVVCGLRRLEAGVVWFS